MRKTKKLVVLLGVLLVICAAAFAVSRYEEKKEQIKKSGEVILEIPTDNVTAVSWTNENGTFSFTKGEETWTYDEDDAFPVDEERISGLLEQFESFSAAFVIDEAEDYSQYGLDEPECTISITAGETSYTIELGAFSKMDEQRYVSIGDGKAYLVEHDPLEEFDAVLSDVILNDTIPDFDTAEEITFSGAEAYTITRDENGTSICADDVYYTDGKPLDSDLVDSLLSKIRTLELSDYVTYKVSDEELETFGLREPELTISLDYSVSAEDENAAESGSLQLSLSRNPEEAAAYEEAVEQEKEELPEVTCYVRVGQSPIIYKISQDTYDKLTAVSYDTLRHQELFSGDFDQVTAVDITLNGETITFTCSSAEDQDAEETWTYQDKEFDASAVKNAICALEAADFTEEVPSGQEEISLTLHLDNEEFPTFTLNLYRYDGTNCIAEVNGEPTALVSRSQTVDLIEAVNEQILGNESE